MAIYFFKMFALSILVAFLCYLSLATETSAATLRIGVRPDAEPFSYKISTTNPTTVIGEKYYEKSFQIDDSDHFFVGYLVHICVTVLQELASRKNISEFKVELVEVTAENRFQMVRDGKIDILCGPSTINRDRVGIKNLMASQPLYLSGQAIAQLPGKKLWKSHWPCRGPLIGVVKGTTSDTDAIRKIHKLQGLPPTFHSQISNWLNSNYSNPEVDCERQSSNNPLRQPFAGWADDNQKLPIKQFRDHDEAADALCNAEIAFYLGDFEILRRKLENRKVKNADCGWAGLSRIFTDERYGLFIHIGQDGDTNYLVANFLKILGEKIHRGSDSILFKALKASIGGDSLENKRLDVFFWSVIAN